MAGPYFKQWRKKRGMTLEQVADRLALLDDPLIPSSVGSLSRFEAGIQPWNQRIVEALASPEIYDCTVDELMTVDPLHRDELDELMARMKGESEHERRRIARIMAAVVSAEIPEERKSEPG